MIKKKTEKLRGWADFSSRLFSYSVTLAILFMISKATFNVPSNYHEIGNYRGVLHHEIPTFLIIFVVPLLIISSRNGKFVRTMIFSKSSIKILFGVFFGFVASSIYFVLGVLAYASALNHAYGGVWIASFAFGLLLILLSLFFIFDTADIFFKTL
jgi:hypothetical protein